MGNRDFPDPRSALAPVLVQITNRTFLLAWTDVRQSHQRSGRAPACSDRGGGRAAACAAQAGALRAAADADRRIPDAPRGPHLCLLRGRQRHPFVLSVHGPAADPDPPRLPFQVHVRSRDRPAARLPAHRPGVHRPQSQCADLRPAARRGGFAGDPAHHLDGRLPAAGGGAEQDLGIPAQPQLSGKPAGLARAGVRLRLPGAALHRPQRRTSRTAAVDDATAKRSCPSASPPS